jgi:DNA-binding FadR family transcriptional regulator
MFTEISRTTAVEEVRSQLLASIRSGELAPGDRLDSEQTLARAFGVSRPVIREALGGLRSMGLIVSQAGRGSFVAEPAADPSRLLLGEFPPEALHEVRCHVEIPGAGLAALRRTGEHIERMQSILAGVSESGVPLEMVALDASFHVTLAEATGNLVHRRLVEGLRELVVQQSFALAEQPGRAAAASQEHEDILARVIEQDAEGARRAMAKHLRAVMFATPAGSAVLAEYAIPTAS